jgi:hypothetical protein
MKPKPDGQYKGCPLCNGWGALEPVRDDSGSNAPDTCYRCQGTGWIAEASSKTVSVPDNLVRIVIVPCHGSPFMAWIEPELETSQAIVGGMIEIARNRVKDSSVDIACNEEGIMMGLPHNGCGMLGNYFFCAIDGNGDERSLTDAEVGAAMAFWMANRTQPHPDPDGKSGFIFIEMRDGMKSNRVDG